MPRGQTPRPNAHRGFTVPTPVRLIGTLALLAVLGSGSLLLPGIGARPLALNEAVFTAVSALSVTGLSIIAPATELTTAGQFLLLILIQLGGIGYMVLAVTILQVLGRSIRLTDRLALQDDLGLLSLGGIVALTRRIVATVLAIEGVGALLLFLHWQRFMPPEIAIKNALFHSVSSFCNAGFDLFGGDPRFPAGLPTDGLTLLILGTLIVLGGLGIPVIAEVLSWRSRMRLSLHSRLTLLVVLFLTLWGALGLFVSETRPGGVLHGLGPWRQIELSLFQSVSCRTAGFVGMPQFDTLDPASQLMILTLMFIGCAPASMGGGVTTGTFLVLVLALAAYAKGRSTPIIGGRAIPGEMIRKAAAVLTISLFAVLTSTWLILLTHEVSLERAVFEVVSAFATCGLTLAFTDELNGFGQAVIIFMMFWGRVGALTLLFALTRKGPLRKVDYPEEKVLIG
jgi:trk system potassium uptake protein TrkH